MSSFPGKWEKIIKSSMEILEGEYSSEKYIQF